MPESGFGRCDGHHELLDLPEKVPLGELAIGSSAAKP
jgi:hypothetical protein